MDRSYVCNKVRSLLAAKGLLDTESVTGEVVTGLWRQDPSLSAMEPLRPVYTGDFCRGNLMQFLWRESCNFKIARVNQVRLSVRFVAAMSQGFRACLKLDATLARQKLHRVAATKIACVNGPLEIPTRGHNPSVEAKHVRDVFKDYFVHEETVEWQWERC